MLWPVGPSCRDGPLCAILCESVGLSKSRHALSLPAEGIYFATREYGEPILLNFTIRILAALPVYMHTNPKERKPLFSRGFPSVIYGDVLTLAEQYHVAGYITHSKNSTQNEIPATVGKNVLVNQNSDDCPWFGFPKES